jgi:coenzyme F420-reducing hydrogenase beta subunit
MGVDRWTQKAHPRVVYDADELGKCAGSRYTSNAVLESIKEPKGKNVAAHWNALYRPGCGSSQEVLGIE